MCCNTNRSLETSAKNMVVYPTFITQCSVTKVLKFGSNHRGGTKCKSAKVPNCLSSFFLEKAYLKTALSFNCAFSMKGQHFFGCRSTVS